MKCSLLVKILPIFLIIFLAREALCENRQGELYILTWADYMDPEIISSFENKYKIKIHMVYYDGDDQRDEIMATTNGTGFDLVVVSGVQLRSYAKQGWLEKIDVNKINNLKYIDKKWIDEFNDGIFAVPYFWGTLGIAYRRDLVGKKLSSWMDILNPSEELRGKIYMLDQSRDVVGVSLKALGHSFNSAVSEELGEAQKLLSGQKPYVKDYHVLKIDESSVLVKGDISVAMAFNGDAVKLKEYNKNICFVTPKEGTVLWIDHIAILRESSHKDLAHAFIDYINEPARAAKLARFVCYATPNMAAERLLPKDFKNNKDIYPDKNILAASERYSDIPIQAIKSRDEAMDIIRK